jgi:hypothetical protein
MNHCQDNIVDYTRDEIPNLTGLALKITSLYREEIVDTQQASSKPMPCFARLRSAWAASIRTSPRSYCTSYPYLYQTHKRHGAFLQ